MHHYKNTRAIPCQTVYNIELDDARNRTKRWRELHENENNFQYAKAFTANIDEMIELIDRIRNYNENAGPENQITALRYYIGLNDIAELNGAPECIMMVPVCGFKLNENCKPLHNGTDFCVNLDGSSNVFDFTFPCPNACDENSPLMINP